MTPVMICPTYTRPDLLERMLRSVDHPVGRGLIIDNARTGLAKRAAAKVHVGPEWRIFQPPFGSLGLPGSINFGIMQTFDAPWWLWCSDDLVFSPGDLATIADLMDGADGPLMVTFRFAVLALNRAVVEKVGLFDEWGFWPLYFDDMDYSYRCHLAGIPIIHRQWGITEGADGFDHSMTIRDEANALANNRSWIENERAYKAKWGGLPGHEKYRTPWAKRLPLWAVRPDLDGRVARAW